MGFVDFEATVASDNEVGSEDEVSDVDSLKFFVDDNMEVQEDRTYYRNFENVTKSADETLGDEFNKSMREIENFDEVSNFLKSSEEEGQVEEFKNVEKRIAKFEETLHPYGAEKTISSFVYAILLVPRFDVSEKLGVCRQNELQETIGSSLFLKLFDNKDRITLELKNHKFHLQCMEINDILTDSSYFIWVYELKKKFRHLILKDKKKKKKTVVRQLSSCIYEKVNGFNIINIEHGKKLRKKFKAIDIVYKPVRKFDAEIKCYFSQDTSRAYRSTWSKGEKLLHGFASQCYYCSKFFCKIRQAETTHVTLLWCSGYCLQF